MKYGNINDEMLQTMTAHQAPDVSVNLTLHDYERGMDSL